MEIKWLEDFIALADHGSLSKASDARFVSQPAFGRRIKALENWLGVSLIDRDQYPTTLTAGGLQFVDQARAWVAEFYAVRDRMRSDSTGDDSLSIVTQHSLSLTYLPRWLQSMRSVIGSRLVRIEPYNLHDCIDAVLAGRGDFLLCYYAPEIFPQLEQGSLISQQIGSDRLIPVSLADPRGKPVFDPNRLNEFAVVNYPSETFFGKLIERQGLLSESQNARYKVAFENALVEGVKGLVLTGAGIGWLPETVVAEDLRNGRIVLLSDSLPSLDLRIMLYRRPDLRITTALEIWNSADLLGRPAV